jgi:hypothetical protein
MQHPAENGRWSWPEWTRVSAIHPYQRICYDEIREEAEPGRELDLRPVHAL